MKKIIIFLVLACLPSLINAQWIQLASPSVNSLYCVYFNNASTGYISGSLSGSVIKTTDGGTSWIFNTTGTNSTFYDMRFLDFLTGFVVGSAQQVIKTTNAGANWDIKTSGSSTLYSVSFPSVLVGYAVGGGFPSVLIKSTDGGNNWTNLVSPSSNTLRGVYFVTTLAGWLCGSSGTIWRTTDGCASWIPQTQSSSYYFEKLQFLDGATGYVVGSGGVILKTTNAGINWVPLSSGVTNTLYDLQFANYSTGWAVGSSGRIIKTTNGGINWFIQNSPSGTATYNAIHMVDVNNGYIVGSGGILLKTTNGGGVPYQPCFVKVTGDPVVSDNAWSEGCAWGDYDADGDQDLVVTCYNDGYQSNNYPILLYRNDGGVFTRITSGPIATEITRSFGCAWGDYDNDGRIDLFVCTGFGLNNLLFHNNGSGSFTKITSGSIVNDGGFSVACDWIDYDRDGWLDLFVVNQNYENDFLYHNNGNGTFTRILSGTIVNDGSYGRACATGDYDNDGWIDIFVPCFSAQSDRLYRNNGNGTFTLTNGVIPTDNANGSGATFADYDNDGWLDLFVTNFGYPNFLYHNNGNGTFTRIFTGPGGEPSVYSFGCTWGDYDNDGRIDLYVSNTNNEVAFFYRNLGSGNFIRVLGESISTDAMYGIGNSAADFNLDGKIDFFTANNGTSNIPQNDLLYRNNCVTGNYIVLKLKGCQYNKSGIGARITVKAGGNTYIREVSGGQGYHSQNMLWQHIGLGSATNIDSLIVRWTTGNIQKLANIAVNQYYLVDECLIGVISNNTEVPNEFGLLQNYPNPFNPVTKIKYQLPLNADVKLTVYDNLGNEIETLVNTNQQAGYYEVDFNAENLSSGIYYYKLSADDFADTKKMVVLK